MCAFLGGCVPGPCFSLRPSRAAAPIEFTWLFSLVGTDWVRMSCPKSCFRAGSKLWGSPEAQSGGSEEEGGFILDQFSWEVETELILQSSAHS